MKNVALTVRAEFSKLFALILACELWNFGNQKLLLWILIPLHSIKRSHLASSAQGQLGKCEPNTKLS